MITVSKHRLRLSRVTVGATIALMLTLAFSVPSMAGGLTCSAIPSQVIVEARIIETSGGESKGKKLMDLVFQCPKAADAQGQPAAIQANIDLTLDANVTNNRNFGAPVGNAGPLVVAGRSNITDAVLIINENTTDGPFATPNYLTGPLGVGQSPQYGSLVGSKTLQWKRIFLPVPGVSGNPDVTTIRITNIRANLARPGIPVGAKVTMNLPGYVYNTESGFDWDASVLKTVPMPLPNPPSGLGSLSAPTSTALKIYPVLSPPISGLGSAGVRLALSFTNIPQGSSVFVPPIVYLFRQGSPYANNIQNFDVATTGIPNPSVQSVQSPAYQIPYGNQNPYGSPIYPYPYDFGGRRTYGGAEDRDYNNPWGAPGPWGPGIPWEIPPMKK
jgi:hypothetical protein